MNTSGTIIAGNRRKGNLYIATLGCLKAIFCNAVGGAVKHELQCFLKE